jgi:hypothetical protein
LADLVRQLSLRRWRGHTLLLHDKHHHQEPDQEGGERPGVGAAAGLRPADPSHQVYRGPRERVGGRHCHWDPLQRVLLVLHPGQVVQPGLLHWQMLGMVSDEHINSLGILSRACIRSVSILVLVVA